MEFFDQKVAKEVLQLKKIRFKDKNIFLKEFKGNRGQVISNQSSEREPGSEKKVE